VKLDVPGRKANRTEGARAQKAMLQHIFFQGWEPVLRTAIGTIAIYIMVVLLIRVAGQRTLAKWYAFDLIVTVALGSALANSILSKDVSIAQAVVAFVVLVGLQYFVAWTVVRWRRVRAVVNPRPTLVLLQGRFEAAAMKAQRVAEEDVRAAVRRQGIGSLEEVGAVVLEADGTFSVIASLPARPTALADVPHNMFSLSA
jgi:uncharacterized membrane protein YcaP (DUF421 family)